MFEDRREPMLPPMEFAHRVAASLGVAFAVVAVALALGVAGYHFLEDLAWLDALLNAAMILGGMGPVDALRTDAGKLFAACYALFSGLVFVIVAGIVFAPIVHRFLHRFHLESESREER
ncbi:MAG: hypothetical protein HYU76_00550 [Betaproteobacteria bacterium]|nr:hypothetical protein [Betaproteobacteria bacterium]